MTDEIMPETQAEETVTQIPVLEESATAANDLPAEELNAGEAFRAVFAPFQDDLKAAGLTELDACELLLNIHHALRQDPKATLQTLAEHYGVTFYTEEDMKARQEEREKAAALNLSQRGMRTTSGEKGKSPRETMAMIFDQVRN